MADRSIKINLGVNVSGLTAGFRTAQKSATDFSGKLRQAAKENSADFDALSNKIGAVGLGLTAAAGVAVKKFADFDSAMSNVASTGDDARRSIDALRDSAIKAGADTAFSATESANAIEEMAKAGISAADILGGGLDGALSLAAAGQLEVAEAAEIASIALTQFNLAGEDVGHVADLLAAGAGKAMGDVTDLGMALKQGGLVASQVGLSIEETTAALSAFAAQGLLGSDAGTSLKTMLQRLTPQSKEAQEQFDALGVSAYDAQGNFVGLENLAGQLQTAMKDLSPEARNSAMQIMFGADAVRAANVLYSEGAAGVRDWTAAVDDQGYAAEVAAIKMDNLKGDLEQLGGSLETLLIGLGEGADGPLRSLVQGLDNVVDAAGKLPDPIKQTAMLLVGGGGLVALGVAGFGKLTTSAYATVGALQAMGFAGASVRGGMVRLAKSAGIAGAAMAGIMVKDWIDDASRASVETAALADELTRLGQGSDEIAALGKMFEDDLALDFLPWVHDIESAEVAIEEFASSAQQALGSGLGDKLERALGNGAGKKFAEDVSDLDAAFALMVQNGNSVEAEEALRRFAEAAAEKTGKSVEELIALFPQYADAIDMAKSAAEGTIPVQDALTASVQESADAADDAWDAFREMSDGMLGSRDAARSFQDAIDGAKAAVKENGRTLDITTAKGRENEAALDGIATAGWSLIDQQRELGATEGELQATMKQTRAEFIRAAESMGMSRKDAKALADQLDLIPKKVTSDIVVNTAAADRVVGNFIQSWSGSRIPMTIDARGKAVVDFGALGSGAALRRAGGGSVSGPGTATSDSIPALLSNGEHVLTASDVQKAGGQGAIYQMRNMIQSGLLRFAGGGAVSAAERDAAKWAREVRAARAAVKAARRTKSDRDDDAARKRLDRAEDRLDAARAKRDSLRESRAGLMREVRRGSIMEQGTSGLSGALSVVDSVYDAARDSNLSKGRRSALMAAGKSAEARLTKEYALLERANDAIEKQRDLTQDVLGLRDQIANSIKSEVRLTDTLGGKTDLGYDKPVTSGAIRAYVQDKLGKIRVFNGRLDALRKKGAPKGLLSEVMAAGIDGGAELANALLTGPASDWNAIKSAWGQIDAEATRAGNIATLSQFGTTGAAAEAELKRRESAADKIESAIERLISGLQSNLSTAYIKRAGGGWVYGPGSSTSDSVHLAASNGEYVVNAKSAAAHGPLLEAINSGVRLSLPSVSRPAIQAAPVGGSSVDAVAVVAAALTQMTVQVVNQFGVRESARIVSAGIGEVARNDPGQIRNANRMAGV